jgi:hypothetical protein
MQRRTVVVVPQKQRHIYIYIYIYIQTLLKSRYRTPVPADDIPYILQYRQSPPSSPHSPAVYACPIVTLSLYVLYGRVVNLTVYTRLFTTRLLVCVSNERPLTLFGGVH